MNREINFLVRGRRRLRYQAGIQKNSENIPKVVMIDGMKSTGLVSNTCGFPGCDCVSHQRCSRCKKVYYCSVTHQKEHWSAHKGTCSSSSSAVKGDTATSSNSTAKMSSVVNGSSSDKTKDKTDQNQEPKEWLEKEPAVDGEVEKRQSRCMFCGEELVLTSEDDAVGHMRVCPALQEQLASPDQFTIPTMLQEKNKLTPSTD